MVFQKTRLWVWCAMAFALVMFFGAFADAGVPAEVSSLSLGGMFSQAGNDLNLGFIGGVPLDFMNGHAGLVSPERDECRYCVIRDTQCAYPRRFDVARLGIERFWRCTAGY